MAFRMLYSFLSLPPADKPSSSPHALNLETRGFRRSGRLNDIRWKTRIYEYNQTSNGRPAYPHLILLGVQSCDGYTNTISLGELTLIVTAMRSRAYQPAEFDEDAILVGDAEQSEDGNYLPGHEDKLAFPHQRRFPVRYLLLISELHGLPPYSRWMFTNLLLWRTRL